jgi:hypothetical protein
MGHSPVWAGAHVSDVEARQALIERLSRAADSIKPEPGMDGPHGGYLGGVTRDRAAEAIEAAIEYIARLVPAEDDPERPPQQARIRRGRDANGIVQSWLEPAEDEGRLREALKARPKNGERIYVEEDDFVSGWGAAMDHLRAALAATPEPRCTCIESAPDDADFSLETTPLGQHQPWCALAVTPDAMNDS